MTKMFVTHERNKIGACITENINNLQAITSKCMGQYGLGNCKLFTAGMNLEWYNVFRRR